LFQVPREHCEKIPRQEPREVAQKVPKHHCKEKKVFGWLR
jgi:hypothetical protein